ncbi:MAG: c-type cytochrome biogenesis protein CcsB [Deltaproteobacteria bacterium]|nr:c-type cytochrome biogenesis protein CcsB [Deltaproteobacteria bacterium]
MNIFFFEMTLVIYLVGTGFSLAYLIFLKKGVSRLAVGTLAMGFGVHSLALLIRYFEAGYTPVTNWHESLSFFSWSIVGLFLLLYGKYRVAVFAAFVAPIAALLIILASLFPKEILPLPPVLESFWLPIHVSLAFLGNALFTLGFAAGVMYLIQEWQIKSKKIGAFYRRLPTLKVLDDLNYRCLTVGFPLLTLGIISGSVWAESAWGSYWSWDPKETWSLITWFLYAALLHARLSAGWRGRKAALLAIAGFGALLFTFFGVSFFLPGFHSYL